jgi:hypothetical protein
LFISGFNRSLGQTARISHEGGNVGLILLEDALAHLSSCNFLDTGHGFDGGHQGIAYGEFECSEEPSRTRSECPA